MICHSVMARSIDPHRRDAILDAAHTVFASKGYAAAGIADLAREVGIGHGTVYRYFDNKRAVAEALFDRALARVADVIATESPDGTDTLAAYRAQVRRIGHRLFELFTADPALARLLFHDLSMVDPQLRQRLADALDLFAGYTAAYLTNGVTKGFLRAGLDVEITARLINSMIFEAAAGLSNAADPPPLRDRLVDAVTALMFDGVSAH
jgi:AcrR family transcriptional regulator